MEGNIINANTHSGGGTPDWSNRVEISRGYTSESNGFVQYSVWFRNCSANTRTGVVTVNGTDVVSIPNGNMSTYTLYGLLPLAEGDTVTISDDISPSPTYGSNGLECHLWFIPCK